jgi:hypothetical protein
LNESSPGRTKSLAGALCVLGLMAAQPGEKDDEAPGVHRLRDIQVEEVSLVDRAANKRRFLIIKRQTEMANDADEEDENGSGQGRRRKAKRPRREDETDADKRRRSPPGGDDEDEETDADKRRKPASNDDDGEDERKHKARAADRQSGVEEDDEDAEEEEEEVDEATDRGPGRKGSSKARGHGEDEDEDEEDTEKRARGRRAQREEDEEEDDDEAKKRGRGRQPQRTEDDEDDAEKRGHGRRAARASGEDDPPVKKRDRDEVLKTLTGGLERLLKLATGVKGSTGPLAEEVGIEAAEIAMLIGTAVTGEDEGDVAPGPVAKAGARMAKERLERFNKALELLASVLKELTESREPARGPSAGAAQAGIVKRDGGAAGAPLDSVVANLGELTEILKRQGEELVRLRKSTGVSNAIPVEGSRRRPAEDVSWPLDMNRPISRDQVNKDLSFYE